MSEKPVTIGSLSRRLGVSPKTIRFYEQIGLLPEPERSAARYRLYSDDDAELVRFILKAKAAGFSLKEIGEILAVRRSGEMPCGHVVDLIHEKIAFLDQQLQAISAVRQGLAALEDRADAVQASAACVCAIIENE